MLRRFWLLLGMLFGTMSAFLVLGLGELFGWVLSGWRGLFFCSGFGGLLWGLVLFEAMWFFIVIAWVCCAFCHFECFRVAVFRVAFAFSVGGYVCFFMFVGCGLR